MEKILVVLLWLLSLVASAYLVLGAPRHWRELRTLLRRREQ